MNKTVIKNTKRILSSSQQSNNNSKGVSERVVVSKPKVKQSPSVLHPSSNGVSLSELVANLLLDERNLIKEVDQYDRYGRLLPHPKLLLAGTEPLVKSKAQAIHNIQQSLQYLNKIPNFPIVDFTAEELYMNKDSFTILLRIIHKAFQLPCPANSVIEEMIASVKHRRLLIQRQPGVLLPSIGRRSHSAPPALFMDAIHAVSKDRGFSAKNVRSRSISPSKSALVNEESSNFVRNPFTRANVSTTASSSAEARGRQLHRFASPEPETRRNIPQPTPPSRDGLAPSVKVVDHRMMAKQPGANKQRCVSVDRGGIIQSHLRRETIERRNNISDQSFLGHSKASAKPLDTSVVSDSINKIQKVRALESKRERLLAQQRDRSARRRSLLSEVEKQQYADTDCKKTNRVSFISDKNSSTEVQCSKGLSPDRLTSRFFPTASSSNNWPEQLVSLEELESLKKQPLPLITMAQMTAIKMWLQNSCQLPILEGEGGYYSHQDIRTVNGAHFPIFSEGGKCGSNVVSSPPPLQLPQDRLRNGCFWCLLFHVLEPEISQHTKLLQNTVYKYCLPRYRYSASAKEVGTSPGDIKGINTIEKAKSVLSKVFWLWRIKHCPPLSLLYLGQVDEIIRCNKDVIWGLLHEIYQLYGNRAIKSTVRTDFLGIPDQLGNIDVDHVFPFGNTKAFPHTSSNKSLTQDFQKLPYTALQRRSLDLSLVHWLGDIGVLHEVLGSWNSFPTSLTTLESYLKDGTLLCHILHKVFNLPLPPSQIIAHPHTYSQCINNLLKCVKILSSCRSFPSRFLYSGVEEDIARGHWDVIYGLFEDLHLYYDFWQNSRITDMNEISAQNFNLKYPPGIYPYYGKSKAHLTNNPNVINFLDNDLTENNGCNDTKDKDNAHSVKSSVHPPGPSNQLFHPTLDLRASYELGQDDDDVSFLFNKQDNEDLLPLYRPSQNAESRPVGYSGGGRNTDEEVTAPSSSSSKKYPSVTTMTALDPALQFLGIHEDTRHDIRSTPFPTSIIRSVSASGEGIRSGKTSMDSSVGGLTANSHDSIAVRESVQSIPDIPTLIPIRLKIEHEEGSGRMDNTTDVPETSQLAILMHSINPWLADLVGYPVVSSSDMLQERLHHLGSFFQDGVQLARLLQKLTRVNVTGIEPKPKTRGQKTQNIRKCLDLLIQLNKRIPARILNCEEAILNGEGISLFRLLVHIKRAFPLYKTKL